MKAFNYVYTYRGLFEMTICAIGEEIMVVRLAFPAPHLCVGACRLRPGKQREGSGKVSVVGGACSGLPLMCSRCSSILTDNSTVILLYWFGYESGGKFCSLIALDLTVRPLPPAVPHVRTQLIV